MSNDDDGQIPLFGTPKVLAPDAVADRRRELIDHLDFKRQNDAAQLLTYLLDANALDLLAGVFIEKMNLIAGLWVDSFRIYNHRPNVPVDLVTRVYAAAKHLPERWRIAVLIEEEEDYRTLVTNALVAGDIDEVALLYGAAYGSTFREELGDAIWFAVETLPLEVLRKLVDYPWPMDEHLKGIRNWIREGIEDMES